VGPSGARYRVALTAEWDDDPGGNLRVIGSIHDGGWRRFLPLVQAFIRARDGSFIGERPAVAEPARAYRVELNGGCRADAFPSRASRSRRRRNES
jgi:hypothetical protein